MPRPPNDQHALAVRDGALETYAHPWRRGGRLTHIERDGGKPRATEQEIRRAPCHGQTPPAAHPEQAAKIEPGTGSHGWIE